MHPVDIKSDAAKRVARPPLPAGGDHHWAWFLDVDGTLLEIEKHPDLVSADDRLLKLLNRLSDVYDGAVALISGRSLQKLETIFNPLTLAAGATHGLELRLPDGSVRYVGHAPPPAVVDRLAEFTRRHRLLLEQKPLSVGVHYRARPELESLVKETVENIHAELGDEFRLMHGKMVVEILPAAADKGTAIGAFMQMPPFAGRRPVFVGDDMTDEDGFAVVNALDGLSVRIGGDARSAARWQVTNVSELRAWLRAVIQSQDRQEEPAVE